MNLLLSFPGLVFFVLSGTAELFWLSPLLQKEHPRDAKIARGLGCLLILCGLVLYIAGRIFRT